MPNPFFKFKQFTVYHDRCAMKVGTDGVLLGSYVSLPSAGRVLDVGTGTGLVAMMIAQRGTSNLKIDAIEIDKDASEQAAENIGKTAWSNRIRVINSDFTEFCPQQKYDLIVSNPPYFENSLRCTATNRNNARHTDTLSYETLISHSATMLNYGGAISIILPYDKLSSVTEIAQQNSLHLADILIVYPKPNSDPKRCIVTLSNRECRCTQHSIAIENSRHSYTDEYTALTKEFYLKM